MLNIVNYTEIASAISALKYLYPHTELQLLRGSVFSRTAVNKCACGLSFHIAGEVEVVKETVHQGTRGTHMDMDMYTRTQT